MKWVQRRLLALIGAASEAGERRARAGAAALLAAFAAGPASAQQTQGGGDLFEACRGAAISEDYRAAEPLCDRAIGSGALEREQLARALHYRATARLFIGALDGAVSDYDRALTLDPSNSTYLNNRGWARWLRGDSEQAFEDAEAAVAADPNSAFARDTRAHVLTTLGQGAAALAAYESAMRLDPSYVRLYQEALIKKGYNPGRTDGVYDAQTREELQRCIRDDCRLLDHRDILSS